MTQRNFKNIFFISFSQLGISFSFHFIMVFIPFFIQKVTPYSNYATLLWVGMIMGAPSFAAAFMSTFWGWLANRYSPKGIFLRGLLCHTLTIFLMGFATSLPLLFALRLIQGLFGGISTVGIIIVSNSSSQEWVAKDIGLYQNALTLGQLIGPPAGAAVAAALGYKGAFTSAAVLVFITFIFCFFNVSEIQHKRKAKKSSGHSMWRGKALVGWGLCFTASVQLMFLPSIFPNVFEWFYVPHAVALKWAGLIFMFYTCTAMLGTYILCGQAAAIGIRRLVTVAGAAAVALQFLQAVSPGIISFTAFRMLQTSMIAAIIPLIFSLFASDKDGQIMGFMNSGRFMGNALGPMIGTAVLAFSNLPWVFYTMSGLGFASLLGFVIFFNEDQGLTQDESHAGAA